MTCTRSSGTVTPRDLVTETFLNTNGQYLHYEPEEALALVMRAKHKGARVQEVAAQLRAWSTG